MKKHGHFLFILITTFLVSSVMAQNNLIGPLIGLNLANIDVDIKEGEQQIDTGMRTGFAFGGMFYWSFTSNIGIQCEPVYTQKGAKANVKWTENGTNIDMDQTFKTNYIDIPVLLKASFGQKNAKPYVIAGPYIGLRTGDAMVDIDRVSVNGQDITSQVPSDEREVELDTKSTDFGINIGAGFLFSLTTNYLFIEGQYSMGLTNINAEEDNDANTLKTKGIQIRIGLLFSLGG
jgi:hypothetical protein